MSTGTPYIVKAILRQDIGHSFLEELDISPCVNLHLLAQSFVELCQMIQLDFQRVLLAMGNSALRYKQTVRTYVTSWLRERLVIECHPSSYQLLSVDVSAVHFRLVLDQEGL